MKTIIAIVFLSLLQNAHSAETKKSDPQNRKPSSFTTIDLKETSEAAQQLAERFKSDESILSSQNYCEVSRNTTSVTDGKKDRRFHASVKCKNYDLYIQLSNGWHQSGYERVRISAIDELIKIGFKFGGCTQHVKTMDSDPEAYIVCSLSK